MAASSMSCAALTTEALLAARDARQTQIVQELRQGLPWTAGLSLNIAGIDKSPPGAESLFQWGIHWLQEYLDGMEVIAQTSDSLGFWLLLSAQNDALSAKQLGVALESAHPAARLLDLDVYLPGGHPLSRRDLRMAPRTCLLCLHPAHECVRLKRHTTSEVLGACHALLAGYRPI